MDFLRKLYDFRHGDPDSPAAAAYMLQQRWLGLIGKQEPGGYTSPELQIGHEIGPGRLWTVFQGELRLPKQPLNPAKGYDTTAVAIKFFVRVLWLGMRRIGK